jgi:hypothetical protein
MLRYMVTIAATLVGHVNLGRASRIRRLSDVASLNSSVSSYRQVHIALTPCKTNLREGGTGLTVFERWFSQVY